MKRTVFILSYLFCFFVVPAQYDERFYFPSKKLQKIDSLNYEDLSFIIDKDTLTGIIVKPNTTVKASILYFHGAGGNVTTYLNLIKPLVKGGSQVIMIDFRGYGKSTGTPTHINIAADAQVIFDNLTKRDDIKNTKLVVYGASMGTQAACNLTKKNQDKIKALILDSPLSSFTDIAVDGAPAAMKSIIRNFLISPYSAKEDIKGIKDVNILIIHSKEDSSIPYSHAETIFNNANEPKELWVYKGEHLEAPVKYPSELVSKINRFIQ